MKGGVIAVLVIAAAVMLWVWKPWEAGRYDDTPAGKEAKIIDEHVEDAKAWRPPNTWEARDFLRPKPMPKVNYNLMIGLTHAEATKLVNELYQAGAEEVAYLNIKRSVRSGDHPEGFYVTLPDEPDKRKATLTRFNLYATTEGKPPTTDVRQKYAYFGYGDWNPTDPKPSFMPE
ncbi:MAG: hypothetical protein ACREIT_10215 [Tepidisphaeraceae bacterium]